MMQPGLFEWFSKWSLFYFSLIESKCGFQMLCSTPVSIKLLSCSCLFACISPYTSLIPGPLLPCQACISALVINTSSPQNDYLLLQLRSNLIFSTEVKVNEIWHSHLIRKIDASSKQVKTELQTSLCEFKQNKSDIHQCWGFKSLWLFINNGYTVLTGLQANILCY